MSEYQKIQSIPHDLIEDHEWVELERRPEGAGGRRVRMMKDLMVFQIIGLILECQKVLDIFVWEIWNI
jgi:hypothetical protein